jgi:hypothetical protein
MVLVEILGDKLECHFHQNTEGNLQDNYIHLKNSFSIVENQHVISFGRPMENSIED